VGYRQAQGTVYRGCRSDRRSLLDAGCGTGDTTLYFANLGRKVTGIDFVEEAIRRAQAKAAERGLSAEFLVKDAMTLVEWDRSFMSVIDSGLFHVYEDHNDQERYVRGLAHVLMPGGPALSLRVQR